MCSPRFPALAAAFFAGSNDEDEDNDEDNDDDPNDTDFMAGFDLGSGVVGVAVAMNLPKETM